MDENMKFSFDFNGRLLATDKEVAEIVDYRGRSVLDSGNFLEFTARCLVSGEKIPPAVLITLVSALAVAAEIAQTAESRADYGGKAPPDEGKIAERAVSALAKGLGLRAPYTRKKGPRFLISNRIAELVKQGISEDEATDTAAREFEVRKDIAEDYREDAKKLSEKEGVRGYLIFRELKNRGLL